MGAREVVGWSRRLGMVYVDVREPGCFIEHDGADSCGCEDGAEVRRYFGEFADSACGCGRCVRCGGRLDEGR